MPPKERAVIKDYAILKITEAELKQQQKQDERVAREIKTRETYLKRTGQQWALNLLPPDPSEVLIQHGIDIIEAGATGFARAVWDSVIGLAENAGVDLEYYKYKRDLTDADLREIKETKPEYHAVLVEDLNNTPELRREQEINIRKERKRIFKQAVAAKQDTLYNTLSSLPTSAVSKIKNWFNEINNPSPEYQERFGAYEQMIQEQSQIYFQMAVQHLPAKDGSGYTDVKRLDRPSSSSKVRHFQDMVRETTEQIYQERLDNLNPITQTSESKSNVHGVYDHLKRGGGGSGAGSSGLRHKSQSQTQTAVYDKLKKPADYKPSGIGNSKSVRMTDPNANARANGRTNAFNRAQRAQQSGTTNIHKSGSKRVPGNTNREKDFPGQGFGFK